MASRKKVMLDFTNISAKEIFMKAVAEWQKAQVVYDYPSWQNEPVPRKYVEVIAKEFPDCEPMLISSLDHKSQLVVAYSLITLEMMKSNILSCLSYELLYRRDKITIRQGSFSTSMDLGGLARKIRKRQSNRIL